MQCECVLTIVLYAAHVKGAGSIRVGVGSSVALPYSMFLLQKSVWGD